VTSLLVGQAAAVERLPRWLTRMLRPLTPQHVVAIAWDDVAEVSHVVKLHQTADQLGLNDAERRAARWLARVPGAR